MSLEDSVDDLLARSRREPLSSEERRRLDDALSGSVESRLLHEAGGAFDREGNVEAGDDERIERMVEAASARTARGRLARSARRFGPTLLVGLFLGGIAGAAVEVRHVLLQRTHTTAPPPSPAVLERAGASTPRKQAAALPHEVPPLSPSGRAVPARGELSPVPNAPGSSLVARSPAPTLSAAPIAPMRESPELERPLGAPALSGESASASYESLESAPDVAMPSTAPALFAAANHARVSGRSDRALALYLRLQNEFPDSSEALTSRLSVGLLLLKEKRPSEALEQFRAAARRGTGPTLAEALWGQAVALRELGRGDEERSALRDLLRRFPDSAYAGSSQKRLRELDSR